MPPVFRNNTAIGRSSIIDDGVDVVEVGMLALENHGEWSVVNGQWSVVSGPWSVVRGEWLKITYYSRFTIRDSRFTTHYSPFTLTYFSIFILLTPRLSIFSIPL